MHKEGRELRRVQEKSDIERQSRLMLNRKLYSRGTGVYSQDFCSLRPATKRVTCIVKSFQYYMIGIDMVNDVILLGYLK